MNYQQQQNQFVERQQTPFPQDKKKRFHFSEDLTESFKKMGQENNNWSGPQIIDHSQIIPNKDGADPALNVKQYVPSFETPTAQRFHWVSENKADQEKIDTIANSVGLAVDYFFVQDYKNSQKKMHEANNLSSSLNSAQDRNICKHLFEKCNEILNKNNSEAFQMIITQDLQDKKENLGEADQQKNENLPAVPQKQAPSWKNTMSYIPVVGPLAQTLPDQESLYDATLNAAFGEKWQNVKPIVNYGLLGTGALAASYYLIYKPFFSAPKKNLEIPKPKKKRRRRRRKKKTAENKEDQNDE